MSKVNKVWRKIFLPPCPNCSSDDVEDLGNGKALLTFQDVIDQMNGRKFPDCHKYRCNKCQTVWDSNGGKFQIK